MQLHNTVSLVGGVSLGAGLMYFLDPDRGRRRRTLMRARGNRWSRKTLEFADSTRLDVQNRAEGMGEAVKSWIQPAPPVSDRTLTERVRFALGRYSRHPSMIDVHVTDGTVTISGPVLEAEFDAICHAIARIPGVAQIFNRLERHQSSDDVPALQESQGSMERKHTPHVAFMQPNWSPAARMLAALMGTVALLYGLRQRTVGAATLAASGLGLLVRSATNQEFARLLHMRVGSMGVI